MGSLNRPNRWTVPVSAALALAALLAGSAPAEGQYFGRNKVQYQSFDFQVLRTEHFDVHFYPEKEAVAREVGRLAERWYARLSTLLDHELEERQPLILYATHPDFQQTSVVGGFIGEGTQGVTEAFKQRVVMPVLGAAAETDHLLGHELVHAFQFDISGLGRAGGGIERAARRFNVPLWFVEGMAEYLSLGPVDTHTAMWIRDAVLSGELPSIERLTRDPRVSPYRFGHALWAYIGSRWGDHVIPELLERAGAGTPYPDAFRDVLGMPLGELSEEWHRELRRMHLPRIAEKSEPGEIARPFLTRHSGAGGRIHLSPSLSPDGRWLAFLSDLGFIDVELHLADARTGEVVRRLARGPALDPHFESLRVLTSAGAWSPDGRRFAFVALRGGSDRVVVLDPERGRILKELKVDGVRELSGPTWSPDGTTLVFSGMAGGRSQLYALEPETGRSRRLTHGRYAALQPSYSPDGRSIAYVTDQPDPADPAAPQRRGPGHDRYRIAILDVAGGSVRIAPGMDAGANTSPDWTDRGLMFLSDRTGVPNLYRLDVQAGELFQLTDLFVGVGGVTGLSPSFSASTDGSRLVFSVLENGAYNLYELSDPDALAGERVADGAGELAGDSPARLAPARARADEMSVAGLLADAETGYPSDAAAAAFEVVSYSPRLSLDVLTQPRAGVGVRTGDAFGRIGLNGGIAGMFSDMLGRHTVFGGFDVQGRLDQTAVSAVYLNQRQRWNFGGAVQRIPFLAPGRQRVQDVIDGREVLRDQLLHFRFFDTRLEALASYPFSQVQRVEFSAGVRRISQDIRVQEVISEVVRNDAGQVVGVVPARTNEFTEPGPGFTLFEPSVALVYDNTLSGFTSPFAGQRYRFEIAPTLGSINFTQILADYRRYFLAAPFTLAIRGLHFGRYGREAEDVFQPLFLGFPSLVRGYSFQDTRDECGRELQGGASGRECDALQQLLGSRLGVASAELRFPLIGRLDLALIPAGLPPIEGILFVDAGLAWTSDQSPSFQRAGDVGPGERGIFTSVGVGARVNLLGLLLLEADYVNPLDRPRGWHWQFAFQPGF